MTALGYTFITLGIVLVFTLGGALVVFFAKNKFSDKVSSILLALASGVMVGAALFCLLRESIIDSIALFSGNGLGSLLAVGCTLVGFLLMLGFDKIVDKLGENETNKKSSKLILAILLHNIPEGLSLGVVCGELFLVSDMNPVIHTALSLAVVLGLHNLIQSITTVLVLKDFNIKKINCFLLMGLAGLVELAFAILGIVLSNSISNVMPILMAIAAGVMLFVGIVDLLKDSLEYKHKVLTIIFVLVGLVIAFALELPELLG